MRVLIALALGLCLGVAAASTMVVMSPEAQAGCPSSGC